MTKVFPSSISDEQNFSALNLVTMSATQLTDDIYDPFLSAMTQEDDSVVRSTTDSHDDAKKKPLLSISGATYLTLNSIVPMFIAGGLCIGVAFALYPTSKLNESPAGVFLWPSTIAGDLIVTSIMMGVMTWVISSGLALSDDFKQAPLHITSYPELAWLPAWCIEKWPQIQPIFYSDPAIEDPPSKCSAILHELKSGLLLGVIVAGVVGLPLSLLLLVKQNVWTLHELVVLKALYGGLVEIPVAFISVATALHQCKERRQLVLGQAVELEDDDEYADTNVINDTRTPHLTSSYDLMTVA
eukprot:m.260891 g.260891  ORF g.260891 m.260891 type:complete len:299 (-) comp40836_c0_seq1:681-1577(-)